MTRITNIGKQSLLLGLTVLVLWTPMAPGQMTSMGQPKAKLDGTLSLTLTVRGFQPRQLGIKSGQYGLFIQNRSPIEKLTVNVTQDGKSGVALLSQHTRTSRDLWRRMVIQPGTYRLSIAEHPAWTCTLKVVSK